tara:strand:+ start:1310 stop:2929 length:1620 start_codon:yes stop_codon:yes gene_type:complete
MTADTNTPWRGLTNHASPDGTVTSDFIQTGILPDDKKIPLIDFATQDYASYKSSLTDYLKAFYPLEYNNFAESDLGMMLVNTLAFVGSTLSFKADMLANESFLDTARMPGNIRKLLKLIGVDLRGPLPARADAQLTLEQAFDATSLQYKILQENRTFTSTSERDGSPITWTLYRYDAATKALDLDGSVDLFLPKSDFDTTITTNLLLLEGALKVESGTFGSVDVLKSIQLTEGSIIEGSIEVSSVTEGYWNEIDSLYLASGGDHKVFEKVYDENYGARLIFGDGVRGQIPTPGDVYNVIYRTGGGERGNTKARFINRNVEGIELPKATQLDCDVVNSSIATGGQNAESAEKAKRYAPHIFRAQYRAVTGEDYTAYANSFESSVGRSKCLATNRQSGAGANIIDIYCLLVSDTNQLERAPLTYKQELLTYLQAYKMIGAEIVAVDGLIRTLDLITTIVLKKSRSREEETIKLKVAKVITDLFDVDSLDFGESVLLGDIIHEVMKVPEVSYVTIDNLKNDIYISYNEVIQLNNLEINVEYV